MDTIPTNRSGAIDVAFSGHFGHITIFGKLNLTIAAHWLGFHADAKIQ
jgi:hypothetical protein